MSISSGVGDIFSAMGDFAEADAYNKAADIATQNAQITRESTAIQQAQTSRKLFQVEGQEVAATAAGGFTTGGSALNVMRSSVQQAGLQHQILGLQGAVEANSFLQQAEAYKGQATSAQFAGAGQAAAGILSFIPGF